MSKIEKAKNHNGETIFPVTVADAVLMGNGQTLKGKLSELDSKEEELRINTTVADYVEVGYKELTGCFVVENEIRELSGFSTFYVKAKKGVEHKMSFKFTSNYYRGGFIESEPKIGALTVVDYFNGGTSQTEHKYTPQSDGYICISFERNGLEELSFYEKNYGIGVEVKTLKDESKEYRERIESAELEVHSSKDKLMKLVKDFNITSSGWNVVDTSTEVNFSKGEKIYVSVNSNRQILQKGLLLVLYKVANSFTPDNKIGEYTIKEGETTKIDLPENVGAFSLYKQSGIVKEGIVTVTIESELNGESSIGYEYAVGGDCKVKDLGIPVSETLGVDQISSHIMVGIDNGYIKVEDKENLYDFGSKILVVPYEGELFDSSKKIGEYSIPLGTYCKLPTEKKIGSLSFYKSANGKSGKLYVSIKNDVYNDTDNAVYVTKEGKQFTLQSNGFKMTCGLDIEENNYYGYNHQFNFKKLSYNGGGEINISDDTAPVHVLGTTIGANHGLPCYIATIEQHGLSNTSVGTIWTQNGKEYVITRIVDENRIQIVSKNYGTYIQPTFEKVSVGEIVNGNITKNITSVANSQLYPSLQQIEQRVVANGERLVVENGRFQCKSIDFIESYYIVDPLGLIDKLINNSGSNSAPDMGAGSLIKIENVYRFVENLTVIVFENIIPLRKMAFSDFMFTQSSIQALTNSKLYIPNSLPQGGYDFRKPTQIQIPMSISHFNCGVNDMADPNNPVNRIVGYNTQYAAAIGYLPYGVGKNIKEFTSNPIKVRGDSGKIYPNGVTSDIIGNLINVGEVYSAVMYKALFLAKANNGRMSMYHFEVYGNEYVFIDYSASMADKVTIDDKFNGRKINVVEAVNTKLKNEVYNYGFYVEAKYVEGETCYIVVEIVG